LRNAREDDTNWPQMSQMMKTYCVLEYYLVVVIVIQYYNVNAIRLGAKCDSKTGAAPR
jgi:hypothetical protein